MALLILRRLQTHRGVPTIARSLHSFMRRFECQPVSNIVLLDVKHCHVSMSNLRNSHVPCHSPKMPCCISLQGEGWMGGSRCHMSIIRNGNVALLNLKKSLHIITVTKLLLKITTLYSLESRLIVKRKRT